MNEIFYVENRANVRAHLRTILVSYPVWLVNKDADNRFVLRPGDFRVYEFQAVVDCNTFSDCVYAILDGTRPHELLPKKHSPKRKSGREPTGR
jgi:hypothetical protein